MHKPYTGVLFDRSIVAGIGFLRENISTFVEYFLQPPKTSPIVVYLVESVKLIQSIELTDDKSFLVTMVIESLYSKVPFHSKSIPSATCIVDLIEIVLTSHFFLISSDFYKTSPKTSPVPV